MQKEKPNRKNKSSQKGYVNMPNNFLTDWAKALGTGPIVLYLQLLTYCHKEKDMAWPALTTLSNKLGMSRNSLISHRKTLLKYGLIKKMVRRRSVQGNYRSNLYQVTPIEGAKIGPDQVQNLDGDSPKFELDQVQNLNPNNNNLKHYQGNNNKGREDAVVAVDFKKIKEKGEERVQAIREQLIDLDFKARFIEQLLKDFDPKKIEEKLDLLLARKNIRNPAGWLIAALKYDYQSSEQESQEEESVGQASRLSSENKKTLPKEEEASSREKALEMIKKTKKMLANLKKKEEMCNGTKRINCQS